MSETICNSISQIRHQDCTDLLGSIVQYIVCQQHIQLSNIIDVFIWVRAGSETIAKLVFGLMVSAGSATIANPPDLMVSAGSATIATPTELMVPAVSATIANLAVDGKSILYGFRYENDMQSKKSISAPYQLI
jgi:hypothetical protein